MANYNKDFDFIPFASGILRTVDGLRSQGKGQGLHLPEPRINAFYRALGLPAVLPDPNLDSFPKGSNFNTVSDSLSVEDIFSMQDRIILASKQPTENQIKAVFDQNEKSVLDSISKNSGRPNLFPMYVDGSIEIFPQDRRVAGAFMTVDERTEDRTTYHVPFIEFIIMLRMSSSGLFNSETQKNAIVSGIYQEFASISDDIKKDLALSLSNISNSVSDTKQLIDKARISTNTILIANSVSDIPEQNTETEVDPASNAALDRIQEDQKRYLALKQARLSIFNFDDTTLTSANQPLTRNLKQALFASPFINLSISDGGTISQAQKETQKKVEKAKADIKNSFTALDFVLGTFSGLSGTDVMVIIYALFKIDIKALVGLLDDGAISRMANAFGLNFSRNDFISTKDAVAALQTQTQSIFNTLHEIILQTKLDEQAKQDQMESS